MLPDARTASGLRGRLFPGDRGVWRVTFALGAVLAAVIVWQAAIVEREYFTGTNSVVDRSVIATTEAGQQLCLDDLTVPTGTGRVRISAEPRDPGARLRLSLTADGRRWTAASAPLRAGDQLVDFPLGPVRGDGEAKPGRLCLRALGGAVSYLGVAELQSDATSPTIGGVDVNSMLAVWYLPSAGSERTFVESLPDVIDHAAGPFRPEVVGAWTFVAILLLLPALGYVAVRLLATAATGRRGRFPLVLAIGAIGFLHAASWSVITPPFDAPDEQEHYAYAQSIAETGKAPCQTCGLERRSTEELLAVDASEILGYTESASGRPPWLGVDERRFEERQQAVETRSDDGGGTTTAASHAPPYYALLAPAYWAADALGGDVFSRLAAMRLISALLAGLTAALAFLTVRELFPDRRFGAAVAGLLVALQPMVGFIGGAVNNDNAVNATLALIAFLLVRILRRGLSARRGVALGALLVIAPLVKSTGYAAYPAALLALGIVAFRQHSRRDAAPWAGLAGAFAAASVAWSLLSSTFDRSVFGTPDGGAPGSQPTLAATSDLPLTYASYLWQIFLPRLPFMTDLHPQRWPAFDIYVERGFAAFGWYAITFPGWVYALVLAGIAVVAVLAAGTLVAHRDAARRHLPALAVLGVLLTTVIVGTHAAFFTPTGDRPVVSEQGRYAFTALTAFAAVAAASVYGLGKARARIVGTALVVGALGLAYASQLLALASFYS